MADSGVIASTKWARLRRLAFLATNAALADDHDAEIYYKTKLQNFGTRLLEEFESDPILLETLADYSLNEARSAELYREAIKQLRVSDNDASSPMLSLVERLFTANGDKVEIEALISSIDQSKLNTMEVETLVDISDKLKKD